WALAAPSLAQPPAAPAPGLVNGQVFDGLHHPLAGARVTADAQEGPGLHREAMTDASGRFEIDGLPAGRYVLTAAADDLTPQQYGVIVNAGQAARVAFQLVVDPVAMVRRQEAQTIARQQLVAEGMQLTAEAKYDAAIQRFRQAIGLEPGCAVCFFNLGRAQIGKRDYDGAEVSFRKAIELNPDYAEAWDGLASVFTARRQFDRAVDAGSKAADLGARLSPTIASGYRYNEGIYLWNAGRVPEAADRFALAARLDPANADAHYQLALALINQGQLARAADELATYLKLAPGGPHAARARALLDTLRK
ncbi:MAG: tetratricopeptide repeat protein, partial [Acidobacteriota bacterium]|nr:tetratricopeptide repeat protein [Acidobacteriota bacterium]